MQPEGEVHGKGKEIEEERRRKERGAERECNFDEEERGSVSQRGVKGKGTEERQE